MNEVGIGNAKDYTIERIEDVVRKLAMLMGVLVITSVVMRSFIKQ